jgi:hypothetical protein
MNKEKCINQLKSFEIESFSLTNALQGWHTDIFYDPIKDELFQSEVLSQGSSVVYPDDVYICRVEEKHFWDYDTADYDENLTDAEMKDLLETEWWDNNITDQYIEPFMEEIEKWLDTKDDYESVGEWRINKPIYPL